MAGKYKAYPEYKNSENAWLGDVPMDWNLIPLKYLSRFSGGGTPSKDNPEYWNGDIPWVSPKDMKTSRIISTIDNVTKKAIKQSSTNLLNKGALLVVVRSGILQHSIPVAINDVPVTLNQDMKAIKFNSKLNAQYAMYLITGSQTALLLEWRKQGATVESIEQEYLANTLFPVPSLKEQDIIIKFLEHETVKIDTLIEKQKQIIQLLKEKRQAVISHAVTKGLNSNAKMRDSGVEWLGEVPAHWVVRRLKHTSSLQSGIPKGKDLAGKINISIPMLRVANVQDGYLDLNDIHEIAIEPDQLERYSLQYGDVLMNEGGDNDKLGRGAVWKSQISPCIHQNHVFAIRPYSMEPEWLDLLTRSSYAKFHFYMVAKQSTNLASISSTNIKETPLVIPPKEERQEILDYVFNKLGVFEDVEKNVLTQIALLQERRTALISAAVTGKIDVRNWEAPKTSKTNKEVAA